MKRVGIVTYRDIVDGKGRFLQAYALYNVIEKLGYKAEIIDYYPSTPESGNAEILHKFKRAIKNPKRWNNYIKKLLHICMIKIYNDDFVESRRSYECFIRKNIRITEEKYYGYEKLLKAHFEYDAYVCGSDQIWNPYFQGLDDAYYLRFAPKDKRIAYAPSIGITQVNKEFRDILREKIIDIPYVSVREKSGAKIVSEIIGREVKNVLDPTLLLSQKWWYDLSEDDESRKPYILTFFFSNDKYPRKIAKKIAKIKGLEIISIPNSFADIFLKAHKEVPLGPRKFVSLFKNASFICTESFHGVVLALIYNRPFYVFDREKTESKSNIFSRVLDLLEMVGLEDRILKNNQKLPNEIDDIDYNKVNSILEIKKKNSLDYLKEALEKAIGGSYNVSSDI